MRLTKSKLSLQLLFALLLSVVQVQLLNHQADLDAHSGESSCDICIHFGQVGHGVLGETNIVAPVPSNVIFKTPSRDFVATVDFYGLPQPRAPPASSLI